MAFDRVNASGWANGETFTGPQATQLDLNVSRATDGRFVRDYGSGLSFTMGATLGLTGARAVCYDQQKNAWFVSQHDDSVQLWSPLGEALDISVGGSPTAMARNAIASSPAGNTIMGVTVGSGAQKFRRRVTVSDPVVSLLIADGAGFDWGPIDAATSGAGGVDCICWHAGSTTRFVAGLSTFEIETSDNGTTWTARSVPDAASRGAIVSSGTSIVCAASVTSNAAIRSTDHGVNWSSVTMPSNKTWGAALAYSAKRSRFMALASDGDIAVSTDDGATWSAATATGLTEGHSLAVLGSLWLAAGEGSAKVGLCGSLDDGATWFPIFRSAHAAGASSSGLVHVGVNGQVCFVSTDGSTTTAYWTPPLGYPNAGT